MHWPQIFNFLEKRKLVMASVVGSTGVFQNAKMALFIDYSMLTDVFVVVN